ncbi:Endoribonuclease YbeY [Tritonibacter multivorans]|uniref:Endoribonuclease YbeY n=1 Tax=Tritonibacter multivorans TaxID=928856 RepID=A0A0P1G1V8_9RHOB|nr:rRNA maturation RNase YbeY [Tritonibacter multivorans]MDA7419586.1 rRNA maturation RNase YbeY [Tritonibacter multivorans]CUH75766.1 Endoribonuclease YbeY [Tritonibacter multivorans]SFC61352.1 probable rRNA maturation factor [Tritonibacter multivorans]
MILDIVVEDPRWEDADLESHAEAAIAAALTRLRVEDLDWEVSLLACNDDRIAELNAEFREKDKATNVLSWPAQELAAEEEGGDPARPEVDFMGDAALGDIAIAYETCQREAQEAGKSFSDHVRHLIVHGTLHLLGYDHIRDGDATLMEDLEVEILGKMGIADPYNEDTGAGS